MNEPDPSPAESFFCFVRDKVEGPFDLIELAGQIKYANIDADTPVCREGKEDWLAFRDLPEFAAAQEMPVETIARHLEEKERAGLLSKSPKKPATFPWFFTAMASFLLCMTGAVFFSSPGSHSNTPPKESRTAIHDTWITNNLGSFSVECPALLKSSNSGVPGVSNYIAAVSGTGFVVSYSNIAGFYRDEPNAQLFDEARDEFLNGSGDRLISQRDISALDYQARECVFSGYLTGVKTSGRMRIIVTGKSLFSVIVFTKSGKFSDENMDRFLNSFKPH